MTPAPSWPRTQGVPTGSAPVACDRSEWHTPLAAIRTRTWSGAIGASVMSSTLRGSPIARRMAPRSTIVSTSMLRKTLMMGSLISYLRRGTLTSLRAGLTGQAGHRPAIVVQAGVVVYGLVSYRSQSS